VGSTSRSALFLALALILLAGPALAQVKTFRKEIKQPLGTAMSQDDAHATALAKAKEAALDEAGIYLESLTVVKNFQVAQDDITALAAGVLQTNVVEEQPYLDNGQFGIRVVAEVHLDPAVLQQRIQALLADRPHLDQLKASQQRERELLAQVARLEEQNRQLSTGAEQAALRTAYRQAANGLTAQDWFQKGWALHDSHLRGYSDPTKAVVFYSQAIDLSPTFKLALLARGNAYLDLGRPQRAIEDYDQALQLDPKYEIAYTERGIAYAKLGQWQRAIQDYDKALQLDPKDAGAYNIRGNAYLDLGQPQRAIEDYDQAIRLEPKEAAHVYWHRGFAYDQLGQPQRAIKDYDQALQLDPNYATAYVLRGMAYVELGRPQRAIKDYDQALRLDPKDARTYTIRRNEYAALAQPQRAIQDYDQALNLDPTLAGAYSKRGNAYRALGQPQRAIQDYRKACELGQQSACDWLKKHPE